MYLAHTTDTIRHSGLVYRIEVALTPHRAFQRHIWGEEEHPDEWIPTPRGVAERFIARNPKFHQVEIN